MNRLERSHHLLKGRLVLVAILGRRKLELHPETGQLVFQNGAHDVAKRHRRGADLGTDNLEAPRDLSGAVRYASTLDALRQIRMFCD